MYIIYKFRGEKLKNERPRPKGAGYQKRFKKAWQNELFKRNAPRGGEFNPTLD